MKADLSPVLQIFAFTMLVLLPLYIYKNGVFYRADAKKCNNILLLEIMNFKKMTARNEKAGNFSPVREKYFPLRRENFLQKAVKCHGH